MCVEAERAGAARVIAGGQLHYNDAGELSRAEIVDAEATVDWRHPGFHGHAISGMISIRKMVDEDHRGVKRVTRPVRRARALRQGKARWLVSN